jgi:hypothetical protein
MYRFVTTRFVMCRYVTYRYVFTPEVALYPDYFQPTHTTSSWDACASPGLIGKGNICRHIYMSIKYIYILCGGLLYACLRLLFVEKYVQNWWKEGTMWSDYGLHFNSTKKITF